MSSAEVGDQPAPDDFEAKIAALLKVDPKGLSGKHKRGEPKKGETPED